MLLQPARVAVKVYVSNKFSHLLSSISGYSSVAVQSYFSS